MNSVKEMLEASNELIAIASVIEDRLDVWESVNDFKKEMDKLTEVYTREPYDENLVRVQKEAFNYAAINLEYVLSTVNEKLRCRYLQRITLLNLEEKCRQTVFAEKDVSIIYQKAVEELAKIRELSDRAKSIAFVLEDSELTFFKDMCRKYAL